MNRYLVSFAYIYGKDRLSISDKVVIAGPLTEDTVNRIRWDLSSDRGTSVSIIAITKLETP